jgi:glycosyltransferase involved in cell wall biosynthesis
MDENHPLVSVIIPVFNGRNFVIPCIESVIRQDYPRCAIEIILVDDGSTDGTAEIAKQFGSGIRYIFQPNGGTSSARNRGIGLSRGEYVAFLDYDDLWLPQKLSFQVRAMSRIPRPDIVFTQLVQFKDPSLSEEERKRVDVDERPVSGILASTALVRQDVFERVGLFTPGVYLEWADWYMRAVQAGAHVFVIERVLAKRRVHRHNKGRVQSDVRKGYARLVKAALDRNRKESRMGVTLDHRPESLKLIPD